MLQIVTSKCKLLTAQNLYAFQKYYCACDELSIFQSFITLYAYDVRQTLLCSTFMAPFNHTCSRKESVYVFPLPPFQLWTQCNIGNVGDGSAHLRNNVDMNKQCMRFYIKITKHIRSPWRVVKNLFISSSTCYSVVRGEPYAPHARGEPHAPPSSPS